MKDTRDDIPSWCSQETHPTPEVFYATLIGDDDLFIPEEGLFWDFKASWPFSLSDGYFGGIARAVCAFANTQGGILVFGVHDVQRTGGYNKVTINFDKFKQALKQVVGDDIHLSIANYINEKRGNVTVLFIAPRPLGVRPYRFEKKVDKYASGIIWIRSGHEVVEASPIHFPLLFCRADAASAERVSVELDGLLPPSPARIKKFVGRFAVMDKLFQWLQHSDEPRTFLYGKGGSGKSTIAFEFAYLLKQFGSQITIHGGDKIETVLFLSAKETAVNSSGRPTISLLEPDFKSETDLYAKILFHGRWILDEDILNAMTLDNLKKELKLFFSYASVVLFIDDIDTLTTKSVDTGSDYLYRTLCKADRSSKIVYTRPLVIENIIALVRTSANCLSSTLAHKSAIMFSLENGMPYRKPAPLDFCSLHFQILTSLLTSRNWRQYCRSIRQDY